MDSSKSYDPPKMADQAVAMMADLKRRFGMKSIDSPSLVYLAAAEELGRDPFTGLQEDMHPAMIHSFKALTGKRNDPDLPSIKESLTGPHAEEFWKAMDAEIACLEAKGAWEIIERSEMTPGMQEIPVCLSVHPTNRTEWACTHGQSK